MKVLILAVATCVVSIASAWSSSANVDSRALGLDSDPCQGCTKSSTTDTGGGKIKIVQEPSVGNGQCDPAADACARTNCPFSGTLKIENKHTGDLWYTHLPALGGGGRTKLEPNDLLVHSFGDDPITCASTDVEKAIAFYTSDIGGTPVARWGWKCVKCPN